MRKYRLIAKKGEGTFSEVLKAQNVKDNKYHAIKCMKNHFESIDQVNNLREIQALRRLSPHQHIVKLEEVLYDQPSGRLALVFELMDANLYEMIRGRRQYLKAELIQSLMFQLVKALDHMHNKGIFHRDIKPENILVDDHSKLKLADFGSCRGIYSKQPYTEYISTRWYRAPECLLTDGYYGPEMDMWGAGCVFFEITSLYPLFPGANELDQIHRIHKILGTPTPDVLEIFKRKGAAHIDFNFPHDDGTTLNKLIPHASPAAIDLMYKMLAYDPSKRLNAREALRHEYFRDLRDMEEAQARASQQQHQAQAQSQQPVAGSGQAGSSVGNAGAPALSSAVPYNLQHITASTKSKKSSKEDSPETSSSHGNVPLPSIQPSKKVKSQYADDLEDDEPDGSGAHDELPPIHNGLAKLKKQTVSNSPHKAGKNGAQALSTSKNKQQNTGMAVLSGHLNSSSHSNAYQASGSSTNRSGIYQDMATGGATKSKKPNGLANPNVAPMPPAKKSHNGSKSKKLSSSNSLAGAGAGTVGYGSYSTLADGGTLGKIRRK
ncbi:hypothetical protein ATCC90586_005488 [Pythium insidiosum]|nr:hypothetical protein ATCC90586_005488 [Pythium insidiosum]